MLLHNEGITLEITSPCIPEMIIKVSIFGCLHCCCADVATSQNVSSFTLLVAIITHFHFELSKLGLSRKTSVPAVGIGSIATHYVNAV